MGIRHGTARCLASRPVLLLPADPGPALLEAARLYDPGMREWGGRLARHRLVFRNGVLLFGPITMTPELAGQAKLPAGAAVAWYADAALQRRQEQRGEADKRGDGERLVRALARRLGGSTHPAKLQSDLAMIVSVYSEQAVSSGEAMEALRPYAGDLAVDDVTKGTYSLTGKDMPFYTACWPPEMSSTLQPPAALGPLYKRPVHHWDLHSGQQADGVAQDFCQMMGEAALALAGVCRGKVVDVFGFPVSRPGDVMPA